MTDYLTPEKPKPSPDIRNLAKRVGERAYNKYSLSMIADVIIIAGEFMYEELLRTKFFRIPGFGYFSIARNYIVKKKKGKLVRFFPSKRLINLYNEIWKERKLNGN